ncbi:hypothetical protein EGW08_008669 [Elysia chlorotica]|uniref:NAD(P)-binding domain-containing protein n=1 Tax=Elysia chlorotica TaxID=188477 RepID=A0A433TPN4_ELYCH|nr:hypothetical protein EGW08_008669 [Elysia chlorotica]
MVGFFVQRELQTIPDWELHCSMASEAEANIERFKSENHSAFIVGYTGEVGKALVHDLNQLKIFKRVVLIGRRRIHLHVGPEFEQKVINFDHLDNHRDLFSGLDVGFCCLGTTTGKSGTGQVEEALKLMRFDRLSIYRPGMLLCKRDETRMLELVAGSILQPIHYLFPTAISAPVEVVARAMINHVLLPLGSEPNWTLYNNKALHLASGLSTGCRK